MGKGIVGCGEGIVGCGEGIVGGGPRGYLKVRAEYAALVVAMFTEHLIALNIYLLGNLNVI